MTPLTILHVVHDFLPWHKHGTEQATWHLARAQQEAGHRVAVFAGEQGRFQKEISIERDDVGDLEVWRCWFNPRSSEAYLEHEGLAKQFEDFLDRFQPDIIHVQHVATLSLDLIRVARQRGLPVVLTLHDYHYVCPRVQLIRGDRSICHESDRAADCAACLAHTARDPLAERLAALPEMVTRNLVNGRSWRALFSHAAGMFASVQPPFDASSVEGVKRRTSAVDGVLADVQRIIAPSADLARRFERFAGLENGRVIALHHTVNINRLTHRVRKQVIRPIRLGYVGKVSPVKGLVLLLEAIAKLPRGSVELHAYGSPTWTNLGELVYFRRAQKLARHLPGVTLHPEGFPPESVGEVFDNFDLFVIPSVWYENSPLVVFEAFAAGVPVVCPDAGGPAELVRDGVDGRHFVHRDAESLAGVLRELVEAPERITALSEQVERPKPPGDYLEEVLSIYRGAMSEVSDGKTA